MKKTAVILLSVFALFLVFNAASGKEPIYKTDLKVGNLTCGGCLYTIKAELEKLDGFKKMGASLFKGEVYVAHSDKLKAKSIEDAINKAGYPAKVMNSGPFDMKSQPKQSNDNYQQSSCCGAGYSCYPQNQNLPGDKK